MAEIGGGGYDPTLETRLALMESKGAEFDAIKNTAFPQPASAPPPGIALDSSCGNANAYARADHTHKSSVQRQNVSVPLTGATGKGTVTFGQAYPDGVVPVVLTEADTPDQNSYFYASSVIAGSVTNTGFQVLVRRVNASVMLPGLATSLLGFVVNIFGMASGAVNVRYVAAPATT